MTDLKQYRYKGNLDNSKEKKGYIDAPNLSAAKKRLKNQNLNIISLKESNNLLVKFSQIQVGKVVKYKDLIFFLRQLSVLVDSGIRISEALEIVANQTDNRPFQNIIYQVYFDVQTGISLTNSLSNYKEFPEVLVKMVLVGEETGELGRSLSSTAAYFETLNKRVKAIKKALTSPIVYVLIGLMVTISMLLFIFPLYANMLGTGIDKLPFISAFFMDISMFLREDFLALYKIVDGQQISGYIGIRNFLVFDYTDPNSFKVEITNHIFYPFFILITSLLLLRKKYRNTYNYRMIKSKFLLKIPIVGKIIKLSNVSTIATSLANLISNKVDMIHALTTTKGVVKNYVYKEIIEQAIKNVEEGIPLSKVFENHWAVEDAVSSFVSIGESSNNIESMLIALGKYYDESVEDRFNSIREKIQPIIMVSVYILLGLLIIAMILPTITALNNQTSASLLIY